MSWDIRFDELVKHISSWSKDRSRKTACIIVGPANEIRATGVNGFPRGVNDDVDVRHLRPAKYKWTEHAERNAIYNAARAGIRTEGCTMFLNWYPCADCARAIIQCGIGELVCYEPNWNDTIWRDDFAVVPEMLREGSVKVRYLESA